jgi:hypothetical protein
MAFSYVFGGFCVHCVVDFGLGSIHIGKQFRHNRGVVRNGQAFLSLSRERVRQSDRARKQNRRDKNCVGFHVKYLDVLFGLPSEY